MPNATFHFKRSGNISKQLRAFKSKSNSLKHKNKTPQNYKNCIRFLGPKHSPFILSHKSKFIIMLIQTPNTKRRIIIRHIPRTDTKIVPNPPKPHGIKAAPIKRAIKRIKSKHNVPDQSIHKPNIIYPISASNSNIRSSSLINTLLDKLHSDTASAHIFIRKIAVYF